MDSDVIENISFLMIPEFSMFALSCASEPFRVANRLTKEPLYSLEFLSWDGEPVMASNGTSINTHGRLLENLDQISRLVVIAGFNPLENCQPEILAALRKLVWEGKLLVAADTGGILLAEAGLLKGRQCTLHWESISSFRESYPEAKVVDELFVEDGRLTTSAGGTAVLDMMLHILWSKHGFNLMTAVAEQFIYSPIRSAGDHQRMPLRHKLMTSNSHLIQAVELMNERKQPTCTIKKIADDVGISVRELDRVFRRDLNITPQSFYRSIRLEKASLLLRQTDMSVLDIAVSCGFSSASLFSRNYKCHYGVSPSQDRGNRHHFY